MEKKRYILAGTGSRGLGMFGKPLSFDEELSRYAEIVGLYDVSPARMAFARKELGKPDDFPCDTDFDRLAARVEFDAVIVATTDRAHAEIIVKALSYGKRVFSEKPVCINAAQVREILRAEKESAGGVFVTHNMRYDPAFSTIKKVIDEGAVGRLIFVEYNDFLDRRHGADYFRRWHGEKENSGGLAVHKSCHHFDILNYIVGSYADTLYATGATSFYGKNGPFRGERCSTCTHAEECDFYTDMFNSEKTIGLYKNAEQDSGYIRDRCLFREEITTEDHFHCVFTYLNGVRAVYTLTAFCPFEGMRVVFEGTRGRLEYTAVGRAEWAPGTVSTPGLSEAAGRFLRVYDAREGVRDVEIPTGRGGHGGADPELRKDFFIHSWACAERSPRMATLMEGCQAVLMGDAANISMRENRVVDVQALLEG